MTRAIRLRFGVWLLAMLAMLVWLGMVVLPQLKIETDILALLPVEHGDTVKRRAVDQFSQALSGKLLLLIGAADVGQAKQAANAFAASLRSDPVFSDIELEQAGYTQAWLKLYQQHQGYLLSPRQAQLLASGQVHLLENEALHAAFTPTGMMRVTTLSADPLGLGNDLFQSQLPDAGAAQLDGAYLVASAANHAYVLLTAELHGTPFAADVQDAATAALAQARQAAEQAIAPMPVDVVMSGAMQHAKAARERASDELASFGSIEMALVIALLVMVFGTLRPLALAALTLGLAFAAGLCATQAVFGTVHILALVFGSSLIGGVIDYSIHFFADRFRGTAHWTAAHAVEHVGGSILLGLVTTLLGYVVLMIVPFPGLKQIALFCAVGLATGCATVLCAYPVLYRAPKRQPAFGLRLGAWLTRCCVNWQWRGLGIASVVIAIVITLVGIGKVQLQDDVRALQASPPALVAAEKRVASLLNMGIESRYFLVQGATIEQVLQREVALTQKLAALKERHALHGYTALSQRVTPLADQQRHHQLLLANVANDGGALTAVMTQLGFNAGQVASRRAALVDSSPLTLDQWLASAVAKPWRNLWLGKLDDQYASVVTLNGIRDVAALRDLHADGVQLIDRVQSVTDVLRSYRQVLSWLLLVVYVAAFVLLSGKYGWREAPLLLLPSLLASAITVGVFGWFAVPVNLFVILALWLVLGLGVDYGIFLRHGREALPTAVLSITLSALTTLLAFGMLAFSATPFIRSIGLTLLLAITLSWLLVMASCLTLKGALLPEVKDS